MKYKKYRIRYRDKIYTAFKHSTEDFYTLVDVDFTSWYLHQGYNDYVPEKYNNTAAWNVIIEGRYKDATLLPTEIYLGGE